MSGSGVWCLLSVRQRKKRFDRVKMEPLRRPEARRCTMSAKLKLGDDHVHDVVDVCTGFQLGTPGTPLERLRSRASFLSGCVVG